MNRMINAIWLGVMIGSLAVVYLGMVIASPQLQQQVNVAESTVVSQVKTNLEQAVPAVAPQAVPAVVLQEVPNDISTCSLHSAFPDSVRKWCGWIQSSATQHQIDPNLIAAVMMQESGGNQSAYSGSGAVGLLQIMPSDGVAASFFCGTGPCFASRPRTAELLDPQFNIAYGTKMLAGLLQRYGNMREALRAYGPMDVGYGYADIVIAIYSHN